MSKLNCNIVKDLLPSYIDEITSEETNKEIAEHLDSCSECTNVYKRMKGDDTPIIVPETKEIDYLKKIKRKSKLTTILITGATILAILALIFIKTYFIGQTVGPDYVNYDVTVNNGNIFLSCYSTDVTKKVCNVKFSQDGDVVNINVKAASFIKYSERLCAASYNYKGAVNEVKINGRTAWYNGNSISSDTARVYETMHDYVGDAVSNIKTAGAIGVNRQFGEFKNELQTDSEPYGWTIIISNPLDSNDESMINNVMLLDSYALIALIGNLDYVNWEYTIGEASHTYTVSKDMADTYYGGNIKECRSDISTFDAFYSKLNLEWSSSFAVEQTTGTFGINVTIGVDKKIQTLSMSYGTNGVEIGTKNCMNADGSPLAFGDAMYFEFMSDDFTDPSSINDFNFSIHATLVDGKDVIIKDSIHQPAHYSGTYFYTISEDSAGNLILTDN